MDTKAKSKKTFLDFSKVLIFFATIPLLIGGIICSIYLVESGKNEIQKATNNSMLSLVNETGIAFDYFMQSSEDTVGGFAKAPVVTEYLKNPDDEQLAKKAQEYTLDFFGSLEGWEGLYIADWNSKVLTHPAEAVIGKVMREGDRLEELRNLMLSSDGVYNAGIITSPASGELIISMYAPVYDTDGTPLGYVGAGNYIYETATELTDVSTLKLDSAYTYMVDKDGIMLFHPDPEKIGNPVENDAVKAVVAMLQNGENPQPDCVEYLYKGVEKYAAYYVGVNQSYVAVLTADKSEIIKNTSTMTTNAIIMDIIILVIFVALAIVVAKLLVRPLNAVTKAIKETSEGNLSADTNIHSIMNENISMVNSAKSLQTELQNIIGKVKEISSDLSEGAEKVNVLAATSAASSSQIAEVVGQLSEGAMSIATSVQEIDEQAVNMGDDIDNISSNTKQLVELSNDIKDANTEASAYINTVSNSSKLSVDVVHDIAKQIEETNSAVLAVQQALNMIQSIASQTSLLALNASIEAARAGEAGRGFAVVASEIGNLSTQSNDSANQIGEIVKNIIEQSNKSVHLSAQVVDAITEEQSYIVDTQNRFNILNEKIEESLEEIKLISGKLDSLNEVKKTIIDSVSDLSAISQENAASTEEVLASVTTIATDIDNISCNSEETKNIAIELKDAVRYFR